ncbi:MAG: class I SAM-dependent methyltransferase [Dehalococcoidales bacterium]|nr:MAG: class I SAM-dependent methyltransferase [Dehalococcoidales bacterium]
MTSDYKDAFRGTAWYYARYREGYPEEFFDYIKDKFSLSEDDRILDLGCGTGQIAIPISSFVQEVVAMDPEPEMIQEGKEQAEDNNVQNIVWIEGGSEDLPGMKQELGTFKLVTMGTSFHWMDRERTLDELYEIVTDDGGIVIVWNTSIWTKEQNEWVESVQEVIKKYLGEKRRAGSGHFQVFPRRHEEFVSESKFIRMEMWQHHWTVSSSLGEVLGNLYSTSMANPYILGDKAKDFEKDLTETLLTVNPSGIFFSEGDLEAILAWK